ncbi:SapC family protein [Bradyrhizobium prioriisuperbiae]|uniref:SapC family protein n=1 Tax=Bradyrhizobium prioriisuperbiae TaxID=2854389 RepID=UPI0028E819D2|nr:SapC family protein [Bradyrhizobium prioritasuperba]
MSPPADDRWIENLSWVPVSASEIHLACRYYPVAVRFEANRPRLGLIVDRRYTVHALLTADGKWRGAYRPIALRCFPFQAPSVGDDPLSDIVIDPASTYLSETAGTPLTEADGQPGQLLIEMHRLFGLLQQGQDAFADTLDHFLIGDLLVPLSAEDSSGENETPPLHVLDPARFSHAEQSALAAMARRSFASVDTAVACLFSLQNMRADHRPKDSGRWHRHAPAAAIAPDMLAIDDLSLALDDSELISLADIGAMPAPAGA